MAIIWNERVDAGDIQVNAHLHDSGTHHLSFDRYGSGDQRYAGISFQLKAADIDAIVDMLRMMQAQRDMVGAQKRITANCANCEGAGCNNCLPEPHDSEADPAPEVL
jgi:hypothetical protein